MSARARHRPWFRGATVSDERLVEQAGAWLRSTFPRTEWLRTSDVVQCRSVLPGMETWYSVIPRWHKSQLGAPREHQPHEAQPVHLMFVCGTCWTHGEELSYGGLGPYACDLCGRVVARERGHFPSHGHALRRGRDSRGARIP